MNTQKEQDRNEQENQQEERKRQPGSPLEPMLQGGESRDPEVITMDSSEKERARDEEQEDD